MLTHTFDKKYKYIRYVIINHLIANIEMKIDKIVGNSAFIPHTTIHLLEH